MDRYSIALGKPPPPPSIEDEPEVIESKPKRKKVSTFDQNRDSILQTYMSTGEGRQRLATSMVEPIRQRLDYQSLARRVFHVDPLPEGILPIYDALDRASYIAEDGEQVVSVRPTRIVLPTFEINSNPTIPLNQLRERRFSLLDRSQDYAAQDITAQENSKMLLLLDRVAQGSFTTHASELTENVLRNAFDVIQDNGLRAANVLVNPLDLRKIRTLSIGPRSRPLATRHRQAQPETWLTNGFDPTVNRAETQRGVMGTLWGAQVNLLPSVPQNSIYITADSTTFGVMPIRSFSIISADEPYMREIGWLYSLNLGMCCHNPLGLSKIVVA